MAKWCDEGENNVLNIYLKNDTQNSNLYLGLYTNSSEPNEDAVMSGITEPSGNGYARATLAPASWTISPSDTATHNQQTFTCSGTAWGNVYGYFITTTSTGTLGKLLGVENFSNGPYNVQDGGSVKVTPKIVCA